MPTSEISKEIIFFVGIVAFICLSSSASVAQGKEADAHQFSRLELEKNLGIGNSGYDSLKAKITVESSDTTVDTNTIIIKQKSALTAILLSAVVPGGGQVYNGSYWKVPIIIGAQAFFISQWISNNKSYKYYLSEYDSSLIALPGVGNSALQQERDSYHDQRDSYAWYIAGVYLLSMLDAYIDAELSGFDVSPSLGVAPKGSTNLAVSFRIKF